MQTLSLKRNEKQLLFAIAFTVLAGALLICPTFAAVQGTDNVKDILNSMIDVVGLVFSAVGVILAVYSVGQLVLAFKNEDADSKSRASTMLVVAIVLVAFPSIVKGLNLVDKIG